MDKVTFDTAEYELRLDQEGYRGWTLRRDDGSGDVLSLNYFAKPPDMEAPPDDIDANRNSYRRMAAEAGGAIIQVETIQIADNNTSALQTIIKLPQRPHGMAYVGSITIPFRDQSYVVKIQCQEVGTTGMREALVADMMMRENPPQGNDPILLFTQAWQQDPYDENFTAPLMRNKAEDES